jgi:hypothetical protein
MLPLLVTSAGGVLASFTFAGAAEENKAENLPIIQDKKLTKPYKKN